MQTVSEAAVQGFYYKPRVTLDNLRRHREGLIAGSCLLYTSGALLARRKITFGSKELPMVTRDRLWQMGICL